jgi:hypothetical protein
LPVRARRARTALDGRDELPADLAWALAAESLAGFGREPAAGAARFVSVRAGPLAERVVAVASRPRAAFVERGDVAALDRLARGLAGVEGRPFEPADSRAAARRALERCGRVRGRFAKTPPLRAVSVVLSLPSPSTIDTSLLKAVRRTSWPVPPGRSAACCKSAGRR